MVTENGKLFCVKEYLKNVLFVCNTTVTVNSAMIL